MRTIFVIGLVLVCASMAGWFTINRENGETSIKINGDEFRNDARNAFSKGQEYLNRRSGGDPANQQLQPGQSVPASWAQQPQQQFPNQQFQNQQFPNQQFTGQQPNQQFAQPQYPNQQIPNPQFQAQQPAGQQAAGQQQQGGFYYPDNQQAKRPPAPWDGQLNVPSQVPQ